MIFKDYLDIEATLVDYKESLEEKKPRSWLKSVSAFANGQGGKLVFGVKDNPREVMGLEDPQAVVSKITEFIKVRINPAPRYLINEVLLDGRKCVEVVIQNGPSYPYYYSADGVKVVYVRHGDQSVEANTVELNNLILKGINKTFDILPTSYKVNDVSFTLLGATFKNKLKEDFEIPKDLISIGLLTDDGLVTNGGLLLCDQGVLAQSRIFCTRWRGKYKGDVDEDALDDKEFKDSSLITLLQNAEDFIRNNSKNPWSIRGMTREEHSDYPYKAVREVLVNAIIHRDYQIVGSEIHIDMFDDRIEIYSPGGMLNGRRVQDMDLRHIPSLRRNEVISDMFARLHFMDRRGSGIDRILRSYSDFDNKPIFYSEADYFLVTLPNRSIISGLSDVTTAQQNVVTSAQNVASLEKKVASSVVDVASNLKGSLSKEQELVEFISRIEKISNWNRPTKEHVVYLFKKYRYEYTFNRSNIADVFNVGDSGATAILKKLRDAYLITSPQYGCYQFVPGQ